LTGKAEATALTLIILSAAMGIQIPPAAFTGPSQGGPDPTLQAVRLLWTNRTVGGVRTTLLTIGGEYVTAGGKGFVARLEADTGRRIWSIERPFQVDSMDEAGDGSIVAVGLEQARLWTVKGDGSIYWELPTEGPVLALDLTLTGDRIVLGTFFGTLYFAYPMDRRVEAAYRREGTAVIEAALSGDGSTAAVGYSDDMLEGFKWGVPDPMWRLGVKGHPSVLAYSPRGDRLVLGTSLGALYILNPWSGEILWSFNASDAVSCIAFLEDGSRIAVGSHDGYVYLIDVEEGSSSRIYRIEGSVKSIAYIESGSILCIGGTDRRFRALKMGTGEELGSIKAGYWVTSISASENGLAAFGAGNSLYAAEITVKEEERPLPPSIGGGSPGKLLLYGVWAAPPALGAAIILLFMRHRRGRGDKSKP
jgi:WD40 repeat protein